MLVCLRTKSILIINQTVIKLIIGSIDLNEIALRHVLALLIGQVCWAPIFNQLHHHVTMREWRKSNRDEDDINSSWLSEFNCGVDRESF